jgi:cytochrome c2
MTISRRFTLLVVWHALVVLLILTLPALALGEGPFWSLRGANPWIVLASAAVYLFSAPAIHRVGRSAGSPPALRLIALAASGMSLLYLGVLLSKLDFSRRVLLVGSVIVAAGILVPLLVSSSPRRLVQLFPQPRRLVPFVAAAVACAGLAALVLLLRPSPDIGPQRRSETIRASGHYLSATFFDHYLPPRDSQLASGGAIAADPTSDGYILARAHGNLYRLRWDEGGDLHAEALGLRVPINAREFESDVPPNVPAAGFRVADILIRSEAQTPVIYASHHYWKRDEKCFVVRVSSHEFPGTGSGSAEWKTVFESRPCLPILMGRGTAFAGVQVGGNLESLPSGQLLLTMGDHQFDGWYKPVNLVQDMEAHYGKTLVIDPSMGVASIFTVGHRNPQGLFVDRMGRIWSTEHGPQGGDELNLLRAGGNYGYPDHTYGTEYGSVVWPPEENAPEDANTIKPVFAWVPSIGISDLIAVTDPAFYRWKDDLLVASLVGRALWRVRIEGQRVVYAEPIPIGERLRDIAGNGRGEVVLWTDSDSIVRLTPAESLDDGAALFTVRCGGCHDDTQNRIGPHLRDIFDRGVASAWGYDYSRALKALGGRWTVDRLDAFLEDPRALVPGTKMSFEGIPDEESRAKIIEYLRSSD